MSGKISTLKVRKQIFYKIVFHFLYIDIFIIFFLPISEKVRNFANEIKGNTCISNLLGNNQKNVFTMTIILATICLLYILLIDIQHYQIISF